MMFFHTTISIVASQFFDTLSRLPLFIQVILAVIVVGIVFALLKKVVKFAVWLVLLLLLILAYVRFM
jgi:hypothetical protein